MKRFEELITLVREKGVVFELLTHRPAKTCRETTQITGGAVEQGGKALVCYADSMPIMVVLPCSKRLNFQKFKTLFGFRNLRLATGAEVKKLTGLEVGSIPPFGFLFDLPTYTEKAMGVSGKIAFSPADKGKTMIIAYEGFLDISRDVSFGSFSDEYEVGSQS